MRLNGSTLPFPGDGLKWAVTKYQDVKEAERTIEEGYRRLLAEHGGDAEFVQALQTERQGGNCMICHKPFVKQTCAALYWYEPGCRCFPKCVTVRTPYGTHPGCGRFMVYERYKKLDHCTNCYPVERKKKDDERGRPASRGKRARE